MTSLGLDDELSALNNWLSDDVNPATKSTDIAKKLLKSTDNPFSTGALQAVASSSDVTGATGDGVVSLRDQGEIQSLSFQEIGTGTFSRTHQVVDGVVSRHSLKTFAQISVPTSGHPVMGVKINSLSGFGKLTFVNPQLGRYEDYPDPTDYDKSLHLILRPESYRQSLLHNISYTTIGNSLFLCTTPHVRPATGRNASNSTFSSGYMALVFYRDLPSGNFDIRFAWQPDTTVNLFSINLTFYSVG